MASARVQADRGRPEGSSARRGARAQAAAASAGDATADQPTPGRATVIISAAGRYLEASPEALELFGVMPVDPHELHAADVGTFVPDAFRDAARESWRVWVESGMTVVRGEREIIRPDGRRTRVRFEVVREPDGVYHESMVELADNPERRSAYTTLAAVLEAVREAERALPELPKRSRRRRAVKAEVDQLRDAFEQIVRSRMWSP